jgi:hypothetical protein
MLPAHTKNDAVRRFLYRFQNQLLRRRQRTPHKINMLAHTFNVSNSSSFPSPPCTESAEDPINHDIAHNSIGGIEAGGAVPIVRLR